MKGPPVNLVLLGLLILFFGLQLRGRGRQPYTGWLLGWILIFVSYFVWDMTTLLPAWATLLELLRVDFLLLGIVAFLLSFFLVEASMKRTLLWSSLVVVPEIVLLDLQIVGVREAGLAQIFTVVCGVVAIIVLHQLVPRSWARRRAVLYGMCIVTVGCVVLALRANQSGRYVQESVESPMLLAVAILYMASSSSRITVRALGGLGFLLWAEFYVFAGRLPVGSPLLIALFQFWDVPKYFVGMAMILELFETARIGVEHLANRYRALYESLDFLYETHPQPMWIYGARTNRILSANATASRVYGYSLDEWVGMSAEAMVMEPPPESGLAMSPWPTGTLPGVGLEGRRALHRHKNGTVVTALVMERSMLYEGKDARVVLAVDVTEQEKVHQDLFHRAHHDPLTRLPNRELLADRVDQVLARSARDGRCAVLLTVDVDYFKQINDSYGHPFGDECLKLVAERLQSRIRQVDTLARTGGEEFTAIIGGLSRREDAETVAESLRRLFDMPLILQDRTLGVTVSIGGALFPEDGTTLEMLRKKSDDALYRAKRAGRNRCEFHSPEPTSTEFAA